MQQLQAAVCEGARLQASTASKSRRKQLQVKAMPAEDTECQTSCCLSTAVCRQHIAARQVKRGAHLLRACERADLHVCACRVCLCRASSCCGWDRGRWCWHHAWAWRCWHCHWTGAGRAAQGRQGLRDCWGPAGEAECVCWEAALRGWDCASGTGLSAVASRCWGQRRRLDAAVRRRAWRA